MGESNFEFNINVTEASNFSFDYKISSEPSGDYFRLFGEYDAGWKQVLYLLIVNERSAVKYTDN
ncbi:MAG: hypothetical protein BWY74_00979 [Firmicutes bacterium ADurb.Bin419]|nr:MAG: hypothetical protein BWY74_00979 [Firmicutes bacterium ADurb.Bin419]